MFKNFYLYYRQIELTRLTILMSKILFDILLSKKLFSYTSQINIKIKIYGVKIIYLKPSIRIH